MDINSQQARPLSHKNRSTKKNEVEVKISNNTWWPFARVDGKLLEKIHRKNLNTQAEEALF